jgi:hypothetical protein
MWKAVAAPSDGKMGYLQHYLARARAVLRKTYEADEFAYAWRLAGLYSALIYQGKFHVSVGPLLNRLTSGARRGTASLAATLCPVRS